MFVDPPRGRAGWDLGRIGRRSLPSPNVTGGRFELERRLELDGRWEGDEGEPVRDDRTLSIEDDGERFTRGAFDEGLGPRRGASSLPPSGRPFGFDGMCSDPNSIVERKIYSIDCDPDDLLPNDGTKLTLRIEIATASPPNSIEICSEAV